MKSPAFGYVRPDTVEEAVAFLADHDDAKILAGGQSLVIALNMRLAAPAWLVDINRIGTLSRLERDGGEIVVGALVRHAEVAASALIGEHVPLVAQAMAHVAHPAIRNRGTTCGSLAYADPSAEMPACAVALDAKLVLQSRSGRRIVAARDFFQGLYETALRPDELLVEVRFPVRKPGEVFAFAELARRQGDFALAGLAMRARSSGTVVEAIELVVFAAVGNPVVSAVAAELAVGRHWSPDLIERLAEAVAEEIDPLENLNGTAEIKRRQARALLRRTLAGMAAEVERAAGRA